MSHVVQIQTQVRDASAVRAGCRRLGLAEPVEGEFKLYRQTVSGLGVRLHQWKYPVVFDLVTGESKFDNFDGHWGKQERLDEFLQAYAVEKTKIESRRRGYAVTEQTQEDGSIKLTVQVGSTT